MCDVKYNQRGQSLVLFALILTGLLGVVALVADGGMLYADRRGAQNAADSAALAAALARIDGRDWVAAGLERAASNGYVHDGITTTVHIASPPVSGVYAGNTEYVQVVITSTVRTAFAQLVYGGQAHNTVEAVARSYQYHNIVEGYSVYGASANKCSTILFSGSQATNVTGGGVFSNSKASASNCYSGYQNGSGAVIVTGGSIEVAGTFGRAGGSGTVSPTPIQFAPQRSLPTVPTPDCSDLPSYGYVSVNKSTTLQPGNYIQLRITGGPNVVVQLAPGLYCFSGINAFTGTGGSKIIGDGVMLYFANGGFDVGGSFQVNLKAPTDLVDASGNQWAGMLIYGGPTNTQPIGITGDSNSVYQGTIYAKSSPCELAGSGSTLVVSAQVICDTIKMTGNAALTVNYDRELNYMLPGIVALSN